MGDGKVCLAGSGRPYAETNVVLPHTADIGGLIFASGINPVKTVWDLDHGIAEEGFSAFFRRARRIALIFAVDKFSGKGAYVFGGRLFALFYRGNKAVHHCPESPDSGSIMTLKVNFIAPGGNEAAEVPLDYPEISVICAANAGKQFPVVKSYCYAVLQINLCLILYLYKQIRQVGRRPVILRSSGLFSFRT
jgi:hypothetical protein